MSKREKRGFIFTQSLVACVCRETQARFLKDHRVCRRRKKRRRALPFVCIDPLSLFIYHTYIKARVCLKSGHFFLERER